MLQVNTQHLAEMAQATQAAQRASEPQRLAAQLRQQYPELMQGRDPQALLAEIHQALARCDELGLGGAEDRRIFCQWDQLLCPGMRVLPQWPQWLAHCRQHQAEGEQSVLLRLLLETPPDWWRRQLEQHAGVRQARGLPALSQAGGPARRTS